MGFVKHDLIIKKRENRKKREVDIVLGDLLIYYIIVRKKFFANQIRRNLCWSGKFEDEKMINFV